MEIFPASAQDQWTIIKKLIDDCDYYILILAGRYGTLNKDGISYTELEYDYAHKKKIPIITFLHENVGDIVKDKIETNPHSQKKLEEFRNRVQKQLCKFYDSPKTLRSVVSAGLFNLIKARKRPGLIRVTKNTIVELNSLPELRKEKERLQLDLKEKEDIILDFEEINDDLKLRAKYYDTFPLLNNLFSIVHSSLRHQNETFEDNIRTLKDVCTTLKQIFDKITGQNCHACIKMYISEANASEKEPTIGTIARDALNLDRASIDSHKEILHLPSQNTDFKFLLENIQSERGKFFFCNNLVSLPNYKNSSFMLHFDAYEFHTDTLTEREKKWPLPYKSTIVTPICPSIHNERSESSLAGFLCLDAPEINAFNKQMDTEILRGCADGIYNLLTNMKYKKINNATNEK